MLLVAEPHKFLEAEGVSKELSIVGDSVFLIVLGSVKVEHLLQLRPVRLEHSLDRFRMEELVDIDTLLLLNLTLRLGVVNIISHLGLELLLIVLLHFPSSLLLQNLGVSILVSLLELAFELILLLVKESLGPLLLGLSLNFGDMSRFILLLAVLFKLLLFLGINNSLLPRMVLLEGLSFLTVMQLLLLGFNLRLPLIVHSNGLATTSKVSVLNLLLQFFIPFKPDSLASCLFSFGLSSFELLLELSLVGSLARSTVRPGRQAVKTFLRCLQHLFEDLSHLLVVGPVLQVLFGDLQFESQRQLGLNLESLCALLSRRHVSHGTWSFRFLDLLDFLHVRRTSIISLASLRDGLLDPVPLLEGDQRLKEVSAHGTVEDFVEELGCDDARLAHDLPGALRNLKAEDRGPLNNFAVAFRHGVGRVFVALLLKGPHQLAVSEGRCIWVLVQSSRLAALSRRLFKRLNERLKAGDWWETGLVDRRSGEAKECKLWDEEEELLV